MAIKISGSTIIDDSRNIVAGVAATFTGNVTVGGTITYEDVTNIDSVGIVTARTDVHVGENIAHIGDTDTKIAFTDNRIDFKTASYTRLHIDNSGLFVRSGNNLGFLATSGPSPAIKSGGTNAQDLLLTTGTDNPTRLQIAADGKVGIGSDTFTSQLEVARGNVSSYPNGNAKPSGASIWNNGGDTFTGRLFVQGSALSANSSFLTGFNNEGTGLVLYDYSQGEYMQKWFKDAQTELYYNGTQRFRTTDNGVTIYEDTDKVLRFTGGIGEIGSVTGFQATNTAGSALTSFGMRATDLRFATGSAERLRIDSSGVVRVGNTHTQTTSSNTKRIALGGKGSIWGWVSGQIDGSINLADNYYWDGVNNRAIEAAHAAYLSLRLGSLRFGSTDSTPTAGGTTGLTEKFRIDSSGRVLIGTTTEGHASADNLTIETSGNTGMTIRSGTSNEGNIFFSDGTSSDAEYRGMIRYEHDNDAFRITTATEERVRITSAGKLIVATNINQTTAFDYAGVYFTSDNSTTADGLFLNNTAANTGDNVSLSFSTDSGNRKKSALSHVDTGNYGRGDLVFSIDPEEDSGSLDVQAHEKLRIHSQQNGTLTSKLSSTAFYSRPLLEITDGGTPTQIKIITNIPYTGDGSHAHSVTIRGFRYGGAEAVDLQICWHVYNNTFYNRTATSSGAWAPTITLAVESGKVVIHLASPGYWPKMYVESLYRAYGSVNQGAGWTWTDAAISADADTPNETVGYRSNFGNSCQINSSGEFSIGSNFIIPDSIIHDGDTNTKIRFPAADTVTVETAGTERLRIHSDGEVECKGGAAGQNALLVTGNYSASNNVDIQTWQRSGGAVQAKLGYKDADTSMFFGTDTAHAFALMTGGTERLRINTSGQLIMTNAATQTFFDFSTTNNTTRGLFSVAGKDSSGNAVTVKIGGFGDTNRGEIYTHSNHGLGFATNNSTTQMVFDTSGRLLIGNTSTVDTSTYNSKLQVISTDSSASITVGRFSNDSSASSIHLTKSRGTSNGSHTNGDLHSADTVGQIFWWGSDSGDYEEVARIGVEAAANFTTSSTPGILKFFTTSSGATTGTERLRIDSSGRLLIGTTKTYGSASYYDDITINNSGGTGQTGGTGITLVSSTDSWGSIYLGDSDDHGVGAIKYDHNTNSMRLVVNTIDPAFLIDSSGRTLIGHNASLSEGCLLQVARANDNTVELFGFSANANGARINFTKSRNGTVGGNTIVQDDDIIGELHFRAANGSGYFRTAAIEAEIDGTPSATSVPGRLIFSTTPNGALTQTERLRIDAKGEVKIGVGNSGTSMTEFGSGTGGLTLDDIGTLHTGLRLSHGSDDTYLIQSSNSNFYLSQYGTGDMIFGVGSSGNERLRITSDGNLYLGGTSSVNDLTESGGGQRGLVIGSTGMGNAGLAIINSTTGTGRIYFGDNTGSSADRHRGFINYYHNDSSNSDYMLFGTAGSQRLRIDADGRIIVGGSGGTDTSQTTITAKGNTTSATGFAVIDLRRGEAADAENDVLGYIRFSDTNITSDNQNYAHIHAAVDAASTNASDNPGRLVFSTTADGDPGPTERMRITSGGAVILNKGNPSANSTLVLDKTDAGFAKLEFDSAGAQKGYIELDGSEEMVYYGAASVDQIFYAGANERMRIRDDGLVGIGTNNPLSLLDVWGANGAGQIRFVETNHTTNNRYGKVFEYAGNLYFQSRDDSNDGGFIFRGEDNSDTAEFLRIDSSGRTSVGRNLTSYLASAMSSAANDFIVTTGAGANGGMSIVNSGEDIGNIFFAQGTSENGVGRIQYEHANNALSFTTNSGERLRILSGGGIGIGKSIYHLGDTDSWFGFADNNIFQLQTGGSTRIYVDSAGTTWNRNDAAGISTVTKIINSATNASGNGVSLAFAPTQNYDSRFSSIDVVQDGNNNMHMAFKVTDATQDPHAIERMRITRDGKLLVGATAATNGSIAEFSKSVGSGALGCKITVENTSTDSVNNIAELNLKTAHGVARFYKYNVGSTVIQSHSNGTSDLSLYADGASKMRFYTNGNERLRINSDGQIKKVQDTTNRTALKTYSGEGLWFDHYQYQVSSTYQRYADIVSVGDGSWGSNMRFLTMPNSGSPTERLRITSSGSVIIGGSTASAYSAHVNVDDLVVGGTSSHGITVLTGDSGTGSLWFDSEDATRGYVQYAHNTCRLILGTEGSERVGITSEGHFRIGSSTYNPNPLNNSFEDLVIAGDGHRGISVMSGISSIAAINFGNVNPGQPSLYNGMGSIRYYHDGDYMTFGVNSGSTERLRIDSSGHLHTGYTSDFGSDHVNVMVSDGGGISIGGRATGNPSDGDILGSLSFQGYLTGQSASSAEVKISAIASADHSGSAAATDLVFYTKPASTGPGSAPTERMRINSGGDVRPGADSTYDFGSNTVRWRCGYFDKVYGDGSNLTGISAGGFTQDDQANLVAGTGAGAALDADTTYNILIGCNSGKSIDSGDKNISLGCNSGCSVTSGLGNVFLGDQAGKNFTTGSYNIVFGRAACLSGTATANNTIIMGDYAARCITSANDSIALGVYALGSLGSAALEGDLNIAIGCQAGGCITTGGCSIAIGLRAGKGITTGHHNIFLGKYSGMASAGITGSDNVVIGTNAGCSMTSGTTNVFIGKCAGKNATTGSKNIAIGICALHDGVVTGEQNIVMGCDAGGAISSGSYNLLFGRDAGRGMTTASNNMAFGTGTLGGDLNCDFTGTGNIIMGNLSVVAGTSANYNVVMGHNAARCITTGDYNQVFGAYAAQRNRGSYNFASGYLALAGTATAADNTGGCNIAIGNYAGYCLSSGYKNVMLGCNAAKCITEGHDNVSIGAGAGKCTTTGDYNVFLGGYAGKCVTTSLYHVALGWCAGCGVTDGSGSIFIGKYGGSMVKYSNNSVHIGFKNGPGKDPWCSTNDIFIGQNAGLCLTTSCNNIVIGSGQVANHLVADGAHQLSIGIGANYWIHGNASFQMMTRDLIPQANATYNLGSSSVRWANIYTEDLELSNKSKKDTGGNDIDGTWGDWTLQEGETEIFMINNRTGKKFKINMTEVE